jgi:2-polyprenyl-6-methoxyphenol hydroxylase-like FAD-dependent oxidoreductase
MGERRVSLKIAIIGGGPAGLYFGYLMRRHNLARQVTVFEQNPAGATYGFGVVFSEAALGYLEAADAHSYRRLSDALEIWEDLTIVHQDTKVPIDGNGFSGIARIDLLEILQGLCGEVGVNLRFETPLDSLDGLDDYDLIVGSDGVNSMVRRTLAETFQPRQELLSNRFIWYGTDQVFDTLTLTFRQNDDGAFVAHHYRYNDRASTFIVECDAATWQQAEFDGFNDAQNRAYCEQLFAPDLRGHALISNKSIWRQFPVISSDTWHASWAGNRVVLLGDALRSVHFSIGSGTRLALEDSVALFRAFEAAGADVAAALAGFEAARRPIVDKLMRAASGSYLWYESFHERLHLSPLELAHDYMTRSGRVDDDRLAKIAPRFMAAYRDH